MAFSALFDLESVHAIRKRSALKTIQMSFCVASCVANEVRLRSRKICTIICFINMAIKVQHKVQEIKNLHFNNCTLFVFVV